MFCDNAVLHYYPGSPYLARCSVSIRVGKKIVLQVVLRDTIAAKNWLKRVYPGMPYRVIVHS